MRVHVFNQFVTGEYFIHGCPPGVQRSVDDRCICAPGTLRIGIPIHGINVVTRCDVQWLLSTYDTTHSDGQVRGIILVAFVEYKFNGAVYVHTISPFPSNNQSAEMPHHGKCAPGHPRQCIYITHRRCCGCGHIWCG